MNKVVFSKLNFSLKTYINLKKTLCIKNVFQLFIYFYIQTYSQITYCCCNVEKTHSKLV